MQLRQAKVLCPLNHHDRGVGHIYPNLNHSGGHQHLSFTRHKSRHRGIFFHWWQLPMDQSHMRIAQGRAQHFEPLLSGGEIHKLTFFNQGANPICLPTRRNRRFELGNHIRQSGQGHHSSGYGFAARWLFIKHRYIHIAILRQFKRTRNRCCRHHQHIHFGTLFS